MTTLGLPELLALVFAGGVGATAQHIVKAIAAHRDGARARERDVIRDSEDWRQSANQARLDAEANAAWWRDRAVRLWLACSKHGGDPEPLGDPPSRQ